MKTTMAGLALLASIFAVAAAPAQAQDRYIGEVFIFGGKFCPRGTLPADGRILQISENNALFSLMGTRYGGDGRTTFALPNLNGMDDKDGNPVQFCVVTRGMYPTRS